MSDNIVIEACKDEDSREYGQKGYTRKEMDKVIEKEIYYNQESLSLKKFKHNVFEEYCYRNVNLDNEILGYVYYDCGGSRYLNIHSNSDMGTLSNVRVYRKKVFAESAYRDISKNLGVHSGMLRYYKLYPIIMNDLVLFICISDNKHVAL